MEVATYEEEPEYLPDTYIGFGDHKARKYFRSVNKVLVEKPAPLDAKTRRAKQAGAKQRNITDRAKFTKLWTRLNARQPPEQADNEFDRLKSILPNMQYLNMLMLVIASKYRPLLNVTDNSAWNADNIELIAKFQSFGDAIYNDAISSSQMPKDPTPTREGLMKDALRYIKMIIGFEAAEQEAREEIARMELEKLIPQEQTEQDYDEDLDEDEELPSEEEDSQE